MRHRLFLLIPMLLLASCARTQGANEISLQDRLRNPLFAERYWSDMAEHMADWLRTDDPLAKDDVKRAIIDGERERALERVEDVRRQIREGSVARILAVKEDPQGHVLLLDNVLYFASEFWGYPDPAPHVYMTTVIDPRDAEFPDDTSVNLGALQSPYGPQEYRLPENADPNLRTMVLYDRRLEAILAFAQLK